MVPFSWAAAPWPTPAMISKAASRPPSAFMNVRMDFLPSVVRLFVLRRARTPTDVEALAGDEGDDFVGGGLADGANAGDAPLAKHDDAVGDLEGVQHVVGDDDGGNAARPHLLDQLEAAVGLADAEGGEGLVEQYELAAPMNEAAQLDRLALAAAQILHRRGDRRDLGADLAQGPLGFLAHGALAQHLEAEDVAVELAAHEEVGDDVHVRTDRQVLIDRLDAQALGGGRAVDDDRLALEQQAAGIGLDGAGDDLHQGGFAGAVVAQQRHDLAGLHREIDVTQGLDGAEALGQAFDGQHRRLAEGSRARSRNRQRVWSIAHGATLSAPSPVFKLERIFR